MCNKIKNKITGFGSIEILVASAIISVAFVGLMTTATMSLRILDLSTNRLKASFLLEEGLEATKVIRDNGWTTALGSMDPFQTYYFVFEDFTWKSTSVNTFIDGVYERKIVVPNRIQREIGTDDIVLSGSPYSDLGTRGFTYVVSW
ncbi:MAG: hypothetical protein COU27_00180, partial [Candidatus Levybacteria bacterium CG10_big_fil_rev_8_21_14_0_10_36_7]